MEVTVGLVGNTNRQTELNDDTCWQQKIQRYI